MKLICKPMADVLETVVHNLALLVRRKTDQNLDLKTYLSWLEAQNLPRDHGNLTDGDGTKLIRHIIYYPLPTYTRDFMESFEELENMLVCSGIL